MDDEQPFSLYFELRALFYLGALLALYGVGATVQKYVELGPASVLSALSLGVAGCFYYVLTRGRPYSDGPVESPIAAFDYILYLGCGLIGLELAYIESKFHLLGAFWSHYLLFAAALFLFLAYRYDNRLVLATALADIGAWLGLQWTDRLHFDASLRHPALGYAAVLAIAGLALDRRGVKRHFTDAYLQSAVLLAFAAMAGGVDGFGSTWFWLLEAACAAVIVLALRHRRLAYFVYGAAFAYGALVRCVVPHLHGDFDAPFFFLLSAGGAAALVFWSRDYFEEKA